MQLHREVAVQLIADCIIQEMRKNRMKILLAEHNISAKELADQIGRQAQTLRRYVRHEAEPRLEIAETIAEVLGVGIDEVLGAEDAAVVAFNKTRMLPVYGSTDNFNFIDLQEPIDSIETPPSLMNTVAGYAVYVPGETMVPRFNPGEIALVHPGKPFREGDSVVVQLKPGLTQHTAALKIFQKFTEKSIILGQFATDETLEFQRDEIKIVHKIIGIFI